MGSYTIRPASRAAVKPLVGLYSESGRGKTYSALMLARGFAGAAGRIVMIETESGRGEAYEDVIPGGYDVVSMREHFSPRDYGDAFTAAEQANPSVLIVDSASHEWEGAGGVLSMAAKNQEAGKKGPLVWQMPKLDHQRHFVLRLLGTPIPLVIVCMRAKYPMEEKMVNGKKEWTRSETLEPKQSDDLLFEMFVHGWIDQAHNFHGTKYTKDELKHVFVDGKPLTLESGKRLADWSRGTAAVPDERAALLARITHAGEHLLWPKAQSQTVWAQFCGSFSRQTVPLKSLANLAEFLEAEALKIVPAEAFR